MIVTIARKELLEMVRDGRLRLATAVVFALLLAALAVGWQHAREAAVEREAAERATRDQWLGQGQKNPHSAAHYGVYAFKPTSPVSFVDTGVDPYIGAAIWLEAHKQNLAVFRPAQDATALQRFGELTGATVLQLLVPLLIVLLAFGAFAGEREAGTMRQLLSLGVRPLALATGKALGVAAALALLFVPAALLGAAVLALSSSGGTTAEALPRFALMAAAYLLYFIAFSGIALAVSARAPSARSALLVLLAFWILNCLVAPRATSDLSRHVHPTPSLEEFQGAIQNEIANGIDGHNPRDKRTAELEATVLAQYKVEKVEDLPINFDGLSMQASEEWSDAVFDRHYTALWDTYERQHRFQQVASAAAPLLAIRSLSMGFAGTDFAHYRHFATAAEGYRRSLVKTMNDAMTYGWKPGDWTSKVDREVWETVPPFEYRPPGLAAVFAANWVALSLLALWAVGACVAAWIAAVRSRAL